MSMFLLRFGLRFPYYIRIGFGLLVLFGMVGNCAGHHEQAVTIFLITSIMWVMMRIIGEAVDAYHVLALASRYEKELKKNPETKTPPDAPT